MAISWVLTIARSVCCWRIRGLLKILLVEDDRAIVAGLTYLFEEEGFESLVCGDYSQALEAIRTEDFDLALLDVSLPDGSGYDLCKAIKTKAEITGDHADGDG